MSEIFEQMIDSLGIELVKKLDYVFVCSDKIALKYIRYKNIDCFYVEGLKIDQYYLMQRIDYLESI
jgi:hypothetical protein